MFKGVPNAPIFCRAAQRLRSLFPPIALGEQGERIAERFLKRLGYRIIDRRVRGGLGEIDLVAVDRRTMCSSR